MSEKEINLEADTEFRFEIENKNETVQLTLKSGTAEIFGTELVRGKPYKFTNGAKIAVFTWQGCLLEYQAKKNNTSYVSKETPMMFYLNCHCCLEQLRQKAEQNSTRGPVTMVVGPADVGKSTLCRILLNYAVRMGGLSRRPIFVDVDVSQGHISIPGTIGAMVVERPASVEEGFLPIAPLVYNFGHLNILDNPVVFNLLVSRMAEVVHERMKNNKRVNASGIIINTYGWTKGKGYQHLAHVAQAFEVDIILVLDQERLYNELVRDMPSFVKVTLLPKSGGVVERNRNTRSELRETAISEYFYGTPQMQLHPHSFDVKFSDVNIIRIGVPVLPDSCLPIGMKADDCHTKVTTVQPVHKVLNSNMFPALENTTISTVQRYHAVDDIRGTVGISILHHILAVSFINPSSNATQDAIQSNVAGFVCVTNVDADRQTLTLLSPQPKPLPQAYLIISEIQFVDSH